MVSSSRPGPDTVFLVSGGAKGITAQCVIALARRFGSRFVLIGRSPFDGDEAPEWATDLEGDAELMQGAMAHLRAAGQRPTPRDLQKVVRGVQSRREISATLDAVRGAGGEAIYLAADVTDVDSLQAAVSLAEQRLGPVTAILHGAGVLADKLVQDKTPADFERVVSVKADGLRNLLTCVPMERLEMLVLFSSVAGFYGNVGQADYAIANEVLNKAAHWVGRQAPHCRVLAVDWGPWDGGMVTPALREQLVARNVDVIPVDVGTSLLADLVGNSEPRFDVADAQIVVGGAMVSPAQPGHVQSHRIRRILTLVANPFLRDHVIGGSAVMPTVCAVGWMVNACEQVTPGYTYLRTDGYQALKGIVFDDTLADSYLLELNPQPDSGSETIVYDAMISSQTREGRPRYHYRASVTLTRATPEPPATLPLHRAVTGTDVALIEGADLYSDGTLFHGPSFRGIEAILRIDERGLLMRCRQPSISREAQGQFATQTFNSFAVDVQLQGLLVWARRHVGYGGLPLRIASGVSYRPIEFGMVTYVTMEVVSWSPRSLVADVTVVDEMGRVCMEVRGAEITLSERLNVLFAQNHLTAEPLAAGAR